MSLINKEIGDFAVQAFQNGEFKTVTKADVLGKWALFFFYPADFTFVCPTELEELAENYDAFKAEGCEVYSVSCDTHFVHKAWHDELRVAAGSELLSRSAPSRSLAVSGNRPPRLPSWQIAWFSNTAKAWRGAREKRGSSSLGWDPAAPKTRLFSTFTASCRVHGPNELRRRR